MPYLLETHEALCYVSQAWARPALKSVLFFRTQKFPKCLPINKEYLGTALRAAFPRPPFEKCCLGPKVWGSALWDLGSRGHSPGLEGPSGRHILVWSRAGTGEPDPLLAPLLPAGGSGGVPGCILFKPHNILLKI